MSMFYNNLTGFQLSKLYTFEVAARHESFAMAAAELCLTPSAVSHQINQLEKELNIQLFERLHRKVVLSHAGHRLLAALQLSFDHLNTEIKAIQNQALAGSLTIYARPSITQCWLIPKLQDFIQQYPLIELSILTGNEMVNFQRTGIDLALYFGHQSSQHLNYDYLMDEHIVPVCSSEYAKKMNLIGYAQHLKDCTLLHDSQAWHNGTGTEEWRSWASHFAVELNTSKGMQFDRSDLALLAAKQHLGICMGRKKLVQQDLENERLIIPFPEMSLACEQHYYLALPKGRVLPKVDAFVTWLKAQT
ncbi:DNA-binding transcriptional regulator DsdC [Acinetobacter sp. ANC 4178]|uniref:DNA-binding transcriptional regulator DsdC n=1 Tax=Acinetobacter sp. ANC 4178 TaxID=2529839 RepID=UPI0010398AFC|nr:DNA-binding transcriptional regulator DsdC [Acinetobacter sp. ANC 4178]TCB69078.1 DNA-binding transcriptional regulator DsdC [Acinetobacter sp. ANC 4178]